MGSANDVLRIAAGEVGYSRWSDPENGSKYGRWYSGLVHDGTYAANGVAFCAMGASWVLDQAGVSCIGMPEAYCPYIVNAARSAGRFLYASKALGGWLVLFDWDGDGVSDHVGFCESNHPSNGTMNTIEFNTSNGKVARRERYYSNIMGVICPDFDGAAPASASSVSSSGGLDVDGYWGPMTTYALQAALGTPQDGIVSQQYAAYRSSNPGLLASSWEWVSSPHGGSDMVRALQRKVGSEADGFIGPDTIRALQSYLGTPVDGRIDAPSECVKELQRRLNAGSL